LHETIVPVHEGIAGAKPKLAAKLANPEGDDYLRCLYYCLAGRGVIGMIDDLLWLEDLLERRGRAASDLQRRRTRPMMLDRPYVADEPEGSLVSPGDFQAGRSWWDGVGR
jgi:hypothetical protein